jgi:hypothetical protein
MLQILPKKIMISVANSFSAQVLNVSAARRRDTEIPIVFGRTIARAFQMLALLLGVCQSDDRFTVSYGSAIQLRNVGTSLYLASGPHDPGNPSGRWDYFGTFGPIDETWYWNINRPDIGPTSSGISIKCGAMAHISSSVKQTNLGVDDILVSIDIMGVVDQVQPGDIWNVTCGGAEGWTKGSFVQFRSLSDNCFLATRLDHKVNPSAPTRYPLHCTDRSTLNSVWVVESGLFPQTDVDEMFGFVW